MRRILIIAFSIAILVVACGGNNGVKLQPDTPEYALAKALSEKVPYFDPDKNNVLVKSKNFEIRTGEFFTELKAGMGNNADQLKSIPVEKMKDYLKSMAKRFGEQKLLLSLADKAGVQVTDAQIDSILQAQYARAGGEEKFNSMLERRGLSMDFVRNDIAKNLKINAYLDKMLEKEMQVTEQDIENEYSQDKTATVQHILLRTQGKSDSAKQEIHKKMEGILAEAKAGKDFGELAKKYSEDPGSKDRGGLYKDFARGQMVAPFDSAAFSVPVGDISGIVETNYGYHILKVLDRKKETKSLAEVHDQIAQKIKTDRQQRLIPKLIEKLKKDADFEIVEF
ncbi:MAG: hypothetical protein GXO74_10820 [Calditrichaeota bacterium]|nr:hypothetical protein [Calditrichota bacterium]